MTDIRGSLRHKLIPALPVPFTEERIIHHDSHARMADYMSEMPVAGVAVWAHTGRGLYLTEQERENVLTHWRESLPKGIIIAGAGCSAESNGNHVFGDDAYMFRARNMALHAKELGADAILCYPPVRFREMPMPQQEEAIVAYHREIAQAGLPIILFYLYEAAGGISYSPRVLRELFKLPDVIGIKMATLDSVMTFQAVAGQLKSEYPNQLLITGEDRFLGYSLMMGADAALVGMGGALAMLQSDMMKAYYMEDTQNFLYRSGWVDRFAMATFSSPIEGYISRMLYTLSWLDLVSREATHDPWGPELSDPEIDLVGDFMASLPIELKR
ncbi:MAG: dihydrodipicolinate synthase family protein [Bacteroidota bacterium]|nr:dihydrodipicolinate synthase family protein [Bacteroidota bacterium]MDP4234123.1 dihydrodipicolinate synthase family protein [Bacteroidota bacterium]MDP4243064.1 dihydrodipicolinate synthase family protein [Bacteroidota bacterium]MDP4287490.1 dihydrodipicolinate synthase family protein [Bacteroidota bacterium]